MSLWHVETTNSWRTLWCYFDFPHLYLCFDPYVFKHVLCGDSESKLADYLSSKFISKNPLPEASLKTLYSFYVHYIFILWKCFLFVCCVSFCFCLLCFTSFLTTLCCFCFMSIQLLLKKLHFNYLAQGHCSSSDTSHIICLNKGQSRLSTGDQEWNWRKRAVPVSNWPVINDLYWWLKGGRSFALPPETRTEHCGMSACGVCV